MKSKLLIIIIFFLLLPNWGSANQFWTLPVPLQGAMPEAHNSPAFDLQAEKCAACHPVIYNQWQTSRHALASGSGLLGQLDAFDEDLANECLNCHLPRTEQQQQLKSASNTPLNGIDCSACHLRKHRRHGPKNNLLTPHGDVKGLPLFQKSEFCMPCHQFGNDGILVNGKPLENTFEEWKSSRYAREGIQCQNCHMRNNHSFKGIHDRNITRNGLTINLTRDKNGIYLKASNTGAGHALPTYITPRIRLRLESADGKNTVEHIIQRRMNWTMTEGWQELSDTRLFPDQSFTLTLPLAINLAAVARIIVEPDADYYERVYPLLIEQLSEELSNKAMTQLKSARDCSGQSTYVLYSYDCPINTTSCNENIP